MTEVELKQSSIYRKKPNQVRSFFSKTKPNFKGFYMYLAPRFSITLNGSSEHSLFVTSATYTDYEKDSADTLSLTLAPNSKLPSFCDRLELLLGRKSLNFMGAFYVASIQESYLQDYTIEATSIDYTKDFKLKKNRSFSNQSYAQILQSIVRERTTSKPS